MTARRPLVGLLLSAALLAAVARVAESRTVRYRINDLGTLGGTNSHARAINNHGQIAGASDIEGDEATHGFLWSHGKMIDLGTLGGEASFANGINERGDVVGEADTGPIDENGFAIERGVIWREGRKIRLEPLEGYLLSHTHCINNAGIAAGHTDSTRVFPDLANGAGEPFPPTARDLSGTEHAAVWVNGRITDLGTLPDFKHSIAFNINRAGWIAGASYNLHPDLHIPFPSGAIAWRKRRGEWVKLDLSAYVTPGLSSGAFGVNNPGDFVGAVSDQGKFRAVLWKRTGNRFRLVDLGLLPGFEQSQAITLNDRRQIVGTAFNLDFATGERLVHGVTWVPNGRGYQIQDLGTLGGTYGEARSINNRGQIVGMSSMADGTVHAVLWSHN